MAECLMCRRPLDVAEDPLSTDCGGNCWGCVGEAEYTPGSDWTGSQKVETEIQAGLRHPDGTAKPWRAATS